MKISVHMNLVPITGRLQSSPCMQSRMKDTLTPLVRLMWRMELLIPACEIVTPAMLSPCQYRVWSTWLWVSFSTSGNRLLSSCSFGCKDASRQTTMNILIRFLCWATVTLGDIPDYESG